MAKQTILDEVKARMKELQDGKAAQLETIQKKQDEARTQIEAAGLAMKQATEEMDVDSYEEAKNSKRKAQSALDMYSARYVQIKQQEYISEEESDKVIDSLLAYEIDLAAEYREALIELLGKLERITKDYKAEETELDKVILMWTNDIHANYRTFGVTMRTDPFTGVRSDRSPTPLAVRNIGRAGEAAVTEEYLQKMRTFKD